MATETQTHGMRTRCDECGLAYYADENDGCPYCAFASTADQSDGDAHQAARSRVPCDTCGLPYYADDTEACPYCERASREPQPSPGDEPSRDRPQTATSPETDVGTTDPSLLQRITGKFWERLGSR